MTEHELEKIKERCQKATMGPWAWTADRYLYKKGKRMVKVIPILLQALLPHKDRCRDAWDDHIFSVDWPSKKGEVSYCCGTDADREFIASARTDIPKLLAEIERLRAIISASGNSS